jgi:hypothetical protein
VKKRVCLIVALAALLAGLIQPASAVVGRYEITHCSGPASGSGCWGVRGIAANVFHWQEPNVDCGGGLVASVYLVDRDSNYFIEAGVMADRRLNPVCGTWDRQFFVASGIIGNPDAYQWLYTKTSPAVGDWRVLLFRNGGNGTSSYTVQFDEPGFARQTHTFCSGCPHQAPAYNPYAPIGMTSAETKVQADNGFTRYHNNVWVQSNSSPYPWNAANGDRNLNYVSDHVTWWNGVIDHNTGTAGDDVDYVYLG